MSCILCDSMFHFTHNCHIYDSDESRLEQLVEKNWCPNCFIHVGQIHAKRWEERCRTKDFKKCYICFSREHHTVLCPERYTAPNLIVPAIDKDLHKRFFKMFNGKIEKYYLAFISQEMFDLMNSWESRHPNLQNYLRTTSEKIYVYDSLRKEGNAALYGFRPLSLITNEVNVKNIDKSFYSFGSILDQHYDFLFFQVKKVVLHNCELTKWSLFRLLSNYTKIVECKNLKLDETVKFADVIKLIPNIEELILEDTDVFTDEFWADNLLRYKNTKNFSKLQMEIHSYKFNIKSLVKFVETKCIKDVQLELSIIKFIDDKDLGHERELLDKLSEYFEADKENHQILIFNSVEKDTTGNKQCRCLAALTNFIEK